MSIDNIAKIRVKDISNRKDEFALRGIVDYVIVLSRLYEREARVDWRLWLFGVVIENPTEYVIQKIKGLCQECDIEIEIL